MHFDMLVRGMSAWEAFQAIAKALATASVARKVQTASVNASNFTDQIQLDIASGKLTESPEWSGWFERIKKDSLFSDFTSLSVSLVCCP